MLFALCTVALRQRVKSMLPIIPVPPSQLRATASTEPPIMQSRTGGVVCFVYTPHRKPSSSHGTSMLPTLASLTHALPQQRQPHRTAPVNGRVSPIALSTTSSSSPRTPRAPNSPNPTDPSSLLKRWNTLDEISPSRTSSVLILEESVRASLLAFGWGDVDEVTYAS